MKKIILAIVVALAVSALLASCSASSDKFVPGSESLKAVSSEGELAFSYNTRNCVTENSVSVIPFGSEEKTENAGQYSVNGVSVGNSYEDFEKAFALQKGNAMWETCLVVNDDEILFNYPAYTGKSISFKEYDDRFLTVGYFTDFENEDWQTFGADKLKNAWNLELSSDDISKIKDIFLVSAGFDEGGKITMIDVYYGSYADFAEKENYRTEMNYFENETTTANNGETTEE